MRDITRDELEVWKLYAEPEYIPKPMVVRDVIFQGGEITMYDDDPLADELGNRAPRMRVPTGELTVELNTLWKPSLGIPRGEHAFSLDNRRRALAILLDIPERFLVAHEEVETRYGNTVNRRWEKAGGDEDDNRD